MPFGTYKITCIEDPAKSPVKRYTLGTPVTYDNTSPNGGALSTIAITNTNWVSGTC
jgi:hypothetical protein